MLEHPKSTFKQVTTSSNLWNLNSLAGIGESHPGPTRPCSSSASLSYSQPPQPDLPPAAPELRPHPHHFNLQIISPFADSQHLLHNGSVLSWLHIWHSSLFHVFFKYCSHLPWKCGYYWNNNIYLISFVLFLLVLKSWKDLKTELLKGKQKR